MTEALDYRQKDITSIYLLSQRACDVANEVLKPEVPYKPGDVHTWDWKWTPRYMDERLVKFFEGLYGEVYC